MELPTTKPMRSKKRRLRRRRQIAYLAICGLSVVIFAFALATLIRPAAAQNENEGNPDPNDPNVENPDAAKVENPNPVDANKPDPKPDEAKDPKQKPDGNADQADQAKAPALAPIGDYVQWRRGYVGHGTTHEQLGQPHWPPVEYTVYRPTTNYTKEPPPPTSAMNPIYNFTHFLYDNILYSDDPIPAGE